MDDPSAVNARSRPASRLGQWARQALNLRAPTRAHADGWALWQAACAGDQASATALVHQLTPQAHGLALQMLARREDAEDVVQEAFVRLWGARPSDAHGAQLATYFNTIVINRCKSWLVKRREFSVDPEGLTELSDARQVANLPPADTRALSAAHVQAAMARLPARQRMALAMWAYADADVPAIARSLELDPNAAHQLLYRAKSALRTLLQEHAP